MSRAELDAALGRAGATRPEREQAMRLVLDGHTPAASVARLASEILHRSYNSGEGVGVARRLLEVVAAPRDAWEASEAIPGG